MKDLLLTIAMSVGALTLFLAAQVAKRMREDRD